MYELLTVTFSRDDNEGGTFIACHTDDLVPESSLTYNGTGWLIDLEPCNGVTRGSTGQYRVAALYQFVDGTKTSESTYGLVPTSTTTVNVTISNYKITFTSDVFSLKTNFGNSIGKAVKLQAIDEIYINHY